MIELENIHFRYSGAKTDALKDLSLHIETGKCVVLSGSSGSGKTTIIRLINALIPSFYAGELTGSIQIDGEEITGRAPHELAKKTGSVFQNPRTQFFNTDTDSELVFAMENLGISHEEMHDRYERTVEELGLRDLCGRDIFHLSGGEKQRIAFGSVYSLSPDIYVLDEPSANLDRTAIRRLGELLLELKRRGKTLLLSEHRLYYLREVADELILIEDGSVKRRYGIEELTDRSEEELHDIGLRSLKDTELLTAPASCPVRVPALDIRNLSVERNGRIVWKDIRFSADCGEIIGVTGANGIGKTTLARTICGLLRESGGEIFFDGRLIDISSRRQCAFLVMQDPNYQLFSDSVENEMTLTVSGKLPDPDEVRRILSELELDGVRTRHPLSLSGGQKQRLSIALAALSDAKVLLFDEPTSGLDFRNMARVATMLKELARRHKAIVVISHDYEFLRLACTRVLSLSR